jgi:transposase
LKEVLKKSLLPFSCSCVNKLLSDPYLWEYVYPGAAQTLFTRWFWRATHSRLAPMAGVAKLIRRYLPNVLTYVQHGITNAGVEALNATIQWVKKTARGFRNVEHFKTAIYFHCGGLDLYPTHTKA